MRTVLNLVQGGDEWKAHRATPDMINGSEIASMLGIDPKTSRSDLLRMKSLGGEKEFSDYVQKHVIDKGHESEALASPIAEKIIGDDLSPLVMTDEIDGLLFSVSLDGITFDGITTFEHKMLNVSLAVQLSAGSIPEQYRPQLEAGLMVSGATRCLFMASIDGDKTTERHAWYESDPALRQRMIAACKQFNEDVRNYVHVEREVAPVAATIEALPALFVQVEGKVLATNLDAFKKAAQTFIDGIKTELVNDQDFADADKMVKFLKDGEERLALAKSQALAQTASIDELFRTVDAISEQMRSKRLALDKLVKAEKDNRRADIIRDAQDQYMAHVDNLNKRVGGLMPRSVPAFAESVKGLKSIDSMRDKVSTALANSKIAANEIADTIEANIKAIPESWKFLFSDMAQICTKPAEDFARLAKSRISFHQSGEALKVEIAKKAEEARIAAAVEAERKAGEARAAAAIEAERMAEDERITRETAHAMAQAAQYERDRQAKEDQRGKEDAGSAELKPQELRQQPDAASTTPTPEEKRAAVVEAQDDIAEFINSRSFGATQVNVVRAIIVEFVKFMAVRGMKGVEA